MEINDLLRRCPRATRYRGPKNSTHGRHTSRFIPLLNGPLPFLCQLLLAQRFSSRPTNKTLLGTIERRAGFLEAGYSQTCYLQRVI